MDGQCGDLKSGGGGRQNEARQGGSKAGMGSVSEGGLGAERAVGFLLSQCCCPDGLWVVKGGSGTEARAFLFLS